MLRILSQVMESKSVGLSWNMVRTSPLGDVKICPSWLIPPSILCLPSPHSTTVCVCPIGSVAPTPPPSLLRSIPLPHRSGKSKRPFFDGARCPSVLYLFEMHLVSTWASANIPIVSIKLLSALPLLVLACDMKKPREERNT
ncbi:hypothetical protein LZ32DRAFT_133966 [Colletotrichum eremochloae]|nr:hypothetical protein LZ32DRAFT_133966 [Colletotrichum eremochloae]